MANKCAPRPNCAGPASATISVSPTVDPGNRYGRIDLAWYFARRVLTRDWRSLMVTLIACAIAAIIATFQYSVYASFLAAGSAAPRAIGPQIWVSAAGVECFDFPNAIGEDYSAAIQGMYPGARVRRVTFGFVPWRSPDGRRANVALVGVDDLDIPPSGFVTDRSDLSRLDLDRAAADHSVRASIGDQTLDFAGARDDLATFLGVPYVLVRFTTARQILRMDPTTVAYLAVDLPGEQTGSGLESFAQRFPELAVRTAAQFEGSSARYWERKTGAGLAVLLAATLAIVLMVFLLANGVMRLIQHYQRDFLSLVGHGASPGEIGLIVAFVAAAIIVASFAISAFIAPLLTILLHGLLPWVRFRPADLLVPAAGALLAFGTALIWARRSLAGYGPEAVFRS